MSIHFQVLGQPGHDNALYVQVDSGQNVSRLLFDCGEDCPNALPFAEVLRIEHLFFSHLHMDHVAGFDSLFRMVYARENPPMQVWGPFGTTRIMQHRVQGFLWNLTEKLESPWLVYEVLGNQLEVTRLEYIAEFDTAPVFEQRNHNGIILQTPEFSVQMVQLDHLTPSLAYVLREPNKVNIDTSKLAGLGLKPGPWLREMKEAGPAQKTIVVNGVERDLGVLKSDLTVTTEGDSIAYLTDFLLDDAAMEKLLPVVGGCKTVVCESQYLAEDRALALKNYHMTSDRVATLAKEAKVGQLILFHVSDRYEAGQWKALLREARAIFPNTHYPAHWEL
jgi:ribonuclease Z